MVKKRIISTFLKTQRRELEKTQPEFAEFLDIPLRTYISYEYGDSGVPRSRLESIAKKLGVTPDQIPLDEIGPIPHDKRETSKEHLIAFLRKKRSELNLTQAQFSEFLDIPFRTYLSYEYGRSTLKPEALDQIAGKLGIGVGEMFPSMESPKDTKEPSAKDLALALNAIDIDLVFALARSTPKQLELVRTLLGAGNVVTAERDSALLKILECAGDIEEAKHLDLAYEYVKTVRDLEVKNAKKQSS